MRHIPMRFENSKPGLPTFENNGFWYGMALGALVGVLAAGPHFNEWSFLTCMGTILGSGIGAGIVGYFAIGIFCAEAAAGFGVGSDANDDDHGTVDGPGVEG